MFRYGYFRAISDRELILVLTWGQTPRDLDSHLTYYDGIISYHIYYSNKVDLITGTNLDIDDTSFYGPEVITVLKIQEGTYRYSVYDYSNGGSVSSLELANSEAMVKVYLDGELVSSYSVPSGNGCLWTVFEIDGSTYEIININTITGGMSSGELR